MDRRTFFGAVAGTAVAAVVGEPEPLKAVAFPLSERHRLFKEFHRYDRPNDSWVPIEFEAIKADDVIRVGGKGRIPDRTVIVREGWRPSPPGFDDPDGFFTSSYHLDPATNQWVPSGRLGS